jgi:hypothetical protein
MNKKEIGCEGEGWIQIALDRDEWLALVKLVKNLWVALKMNLTS